MRTATRKISLYALVGAGLIVAGLFVLWLSSFTIPDLGSFETRKISQSTKIYDRTGEVLLYDVHENVQRTVIPIEEMSRNIKNASVAIEDAEFYEHVGVRPLAFFRALVVNVLEGGLSQGGSTITQQVVKNTLLTSEKKISRKLKEWVLALKLEQKLSKDAILEIYLNETPYGGNIYGVEEAARAFFGKSAIDLSIAQSAYLAALPQAPTFYSPYGNHTDRLEARKNLVLDRMLANNFITKEEYEQAQREEVLFAPRPESSIKAPHFVFYVLEQIEAEYGKRAIEEEGLRVITTLDWTLQQKAERIVNEFALSNAERFNAENAGLVAVDPRTGDILAMVGSRDYFDEEIEGNFNIALANRQPGSAFKPFVYAAAFSKGYTPETVVFDTPTQFAAACAPENFTSEDNCYSPGNYDDAFRGPMTLRDALAQSVNVPAVKVLYLSGLVDSIRLARDMGIETLTDPNRYGLTLVLGGGEVTLLDITSAYATFAHDGIRNPHRALVRIENTNGEVVESFDVRGERVVQANIARQISDILSDNKARTPLYGSNSLLYFGDIDVAAKTGTTNDYRDAWTVGYTPNIAVGAWAGNNDNSSMDKRISGLIITPLWRAFMDEALKDFETENFIPPLPEDPQKLKPVLRGEVPRDANGAVHSILQWVEKDTPQNKDPLRPEQDPQFALWEYGVSAWTATGDFAGAPETTGPVMVTITNPAQNSTTQSTERVVVTVSVHNPSQVESVVYSLGSQIVGETSLPPFTFSFVPREHSIFEGEYTLRAKAHVRAGADVETSMPLTVR